MSRSMLIASLALAWAGCTAPNTGNTTLSETAKVCAPLTQSACGMNAECEWVAANSEHPAHCDAKASSGGGGTGDGTPAPTGCSSYDQTKCTAEASSCEWQAANAEHPARCIERAVTPPPPPPSSEPDAGAPRT